MTKRSSSQVRSSVKPAPEFSSTALEIQDSPPLTSSLRSHRSTSPGDDASHLQQAGVLRWTRLALSLLLVGVGAAIVGCEGHALHAYNTTALDGAFFLPLWPANTDLRPTIGTLVAGTVVVASSLLYFLVALIPMVCIFICDRRSCNLTLSATLPHTLPPSVVLGEHDAGSRSNHIRNSLQYHGHQ